MTMGLIEKLWGGESVHGFIGCKPVNGKFTQQAVRSTQDAKKLISDLSQRGDVYYCPAIFRTSENRQADNVQSLSAFFIDIDCGPEKVTSGTGYLNKFTAKNAVVAFCKVSGIPTPTEIVDSGNGLHCYWPLDSRVPGEIWVVYAHRFKQVLAHHGLLADKSVTADPARFLRIPDTFNYKDPANPKPVVQKCTGGCFKTDIFLSKINQAFNKVAAPPSDTKSPAAPLDANLIDLVCTNVSDDRPALWDGHWQQDETELGQFGYPSHSEGDFSLLGSIGRQAIKLGISAEQLPQVIAEVFIQSKMYRPEKFNSILNHAIPKICTDLGPKDSAPTDGQVSSTTNEWLNLDDGVVPLSDEPPPPRDYVIKDLLVAAKSGVLAGLGGVSKSQLLLQFAVAVALGLPIFGLNTSEGSVMLLMGEEDADEVYRRVNAIAKVMRLSAEQKELLKQRLRVFPLVGADIRLTRSINMSIESSGLSDDIVKASQELEKLSGLPVRLIGLDHAGLVHGGEFNSREDVVQTMRQVNYIAKTTGAAVLLLAHSPKATTAADSSSAQNVAGSAAWVDLSRAAFVLRGMNEIEGKQLGITAEDRKQYVSMTTVKGNYIPSGDALWLHKSKVDGYEVSYLTQARLYASTQPKTGGNRKLRVAIIELIGQKLLTKTSIERYSGKSGDLRASKGAIKAEVDSMLQDGEIILVQPTDDERHKLGIKGPTSGFLKPAGGTR